MNTNALTSYQWHYTNSKFWSKIAQVAKHLGRKVMFYALCLYFVMKSGDVSIKDKAIIIGALGYLIAPIDLLPDYIPGLGLTDDAAALKIAYDTVKGSITPEIEALVNSKLNKWF